jgi:hypothetical protein
MKCRVRESRSIVINEDEKKLTVTGVLMVWQINRGELRSNRAFGPQPNARPSPEVGKRDAWRIAPRGTILDHEWTKKWILPSDQTYTVMDSGQKSVSDSAGNATRTALRTAARSMIS